MKKMIIVCPVCGAKKIQKIPEDLLKKKEYLSDKGIITILIPENTICKHLFVIYVDQNYTIREYDTPERIRDLNKKNLLHYKTIEEMVLKLNPTTLQTIINRL